MSNNRRDVHERQRLTPGLLFILRNISCIRCLICMNENSPCHSNISFLLSVCQLLCHKKCFKMSKEITPTNVYKNVYKVHCNSCYDRISNKHILQKQQYQCEQIHKGKTKCLTYPGHCKLTIFIPGIVNYLKWYSSICIAKSFCLVFFYASNISKRINDLYREK